MSETENTPTGQPKVAILNYATGRNVLPVSRIIAISFPVAFLFLAWSWFVAWVVTAWLATVMPKGSDFGCCNLPLLFGCEYLAKYALPPTYVTWTCGLALMFFGAQMAALCTVILVDRWHCYGRVALGAHRWRMYAVLLLWVGFYFPVDAIYSISFWLNIDMVRIIQY